MNMQHWRTILEACSIHGMGSSGACGGRFSFGLLQKKKSRSKEKLTRVQQAKMAGWLDFVAADPDTLMGIAPQALHLEVWKPARLGS